MRSRGIQAGDVVQVVRWPHEHSDGQLGHVFTVLAIVPMAHCGVCGIEIGPCASREPFVALPLAWLKRLDPPAESIEDINRLWEPERETLKIPALRKA